MISKELLSNVLDREVTSLQSAGNPNDLAIGFEDGNRYSSFDLCINKYELAHKCKEWAYDSDYIIQSSLSYTQVFKRGEINHVFDCFAEQEPEAIFKACQWVLENKDNQ